MDEERSLIPCEGEDGCEHPVGPPMQVLGTHWYCRCHALEIFCKPYGTVPPWGRRYVQDAPRCP